MGLDNEKGTVVVLYLPESLSRLKRALDFTKRKLKAEQP